MDFDYFQIKGKIKGKWVTATLNSRAEKLEEAQAAADELEEAGANGVEIVGVKAGKRVTVRGKNAPKPAKVPKAKAAAQNIRKLGYNTEIVEPAGQLDLFEGDETKKVILKFSERELKTIVNDYYDLISSGERLTNYKSLLTTFEKATPREKIELTKKEIKSIIGVLQKCMKKNISNKVTSSIYGQTKELKDSLVKAYYNV